MTNISRRDAIHSLASLLALPFLNSIGPMISEVQAQSNPSPPTLNELERYLLENARTQYPLPQGANAINQVRGGRDFGATRIRHNRRERHNGIDLFVPLGTKVYPIIQGTVKSVSYEQYAGKFVTVQSLYPFKLRKSSPIEDAIIYTDYMHLHTQRVRHNQSAKFTTVLGTVGKTGVQVSGPHLHLQMYTKRNGVKIFIDPRKALLTGSYYDLIVNRNQESLYAREFNHIHHPDIYARTTL